MIGFKEEDPSPFQSPLYGVDIGGRAAAGAKRALHAHDGRQGHARFLRQGRLAPTQQGAGREASKRSYSNFTKVYKQTKLSLAGVLSRVGTP